MGWGNKKHKTTQTNTQARTATLRIRPRGSRLGTTDADTSTNEEWMVRTASNNRGRGPNLIEGTHSKRAGPPAGPKGSHQETGEKRKLAKRKTSNVKLLPPTGEKNQKNREKSIKRPFHETTSRPHTIRHNKKETGFPKKTSTNLKTPGRKLKLKEMHKCVRWNCELTIWESRESRGQRPVYGKGQEEKRKGKNNENTKKKRLGKKKWTMEELIAGPPQTMRERNTGETEKKRGPNKMSGALLRGG